MTCSFNNPGRSGCLLELHFLAGNGFILGSTPCDSKPGGNYERAATQGLFDIIDVILERPPTIHERGNNLTAIESRDSRLRDPRFPTVIGQGLNICTLSSKEKGVAIRWKYQNILADKTTGQGRTDIAVHAPKPLVEGGSVSFFFVPQGKDSLEV